MISVDIPQNTLSACNSEAPAVREAEVRIKVSPNKMEACLTFFLPDDAAKPSLPELYSQLEKQGICFGIDEAALQQALRRPDIEIPCARGIEAQNGQNGLVDYSFSLENRGRPTELEDGRVDFKSLNLFTIIHKNDVLATKTPPTPGIPGIDIYGTSIPPSPGKDIQLVAGKNVHFDESGLRLIADTDGQILLERNKISVQPILTITGDVDFSTGNIDFVGNVLIHGSVNSGFSVNATGTVDIMGLISGGSVKAGEIVVRHGIQGMNRGLISSATDIIAQFIENADIRAGRDVIVNNAILHSRVEAYRRVVTKSANGQIIGGKIQAGEEIITYAAGRPRAATTELRAGSIPTLEEEHRTLSWQLLEARHELEQLSRPLALHSDINCRTASPRQIEEKNRLQTRHRELSLKVAACRCRIDEIRRTLTAPELCRISIAGPIHPGVIIGIGELSQTLDDIKRSVTFITGDNELESRPYQSESKYN